LKYLSLGTNLGYRINNLYNAIERLKEFCNVLNTSKIYESKPWGYANQDNFLNMACSIETEYSAEQFLEIIKSIEIKMGRISSVHWGPRLIDIDILIWDDKTIMTDNLIIPHKYLLNRDFCLVPILDINPNEILINDTHPLSYYLRNLSDSERTIVGSTDEKIELHCD